MNFFYRKIHKYQLGINENFHPNQFLRVTPDDGVIKKGKILIIAPGLVPIPPTDWGAVEQIIYETAPIYANAGLEVYILNSKSKKLWKQVSKFEFSAILSHSDSDVGKIRKLWPKTPIVSVIHYGFAAFPELWHKSFKRTMHRMFKSDFIVALSPAIEGMLKGYFQPDKIILSPNGSALNIVEDLPSKIDKFLVLGKVEERKRQYEIWNFSKKWNLEIDFIGPIVDQRVLSEVKINPEAGKFFLGPRNRKELASLFSNYKGLLLLSAGEADALVLYEAQLAGLPIFCTRAALGSQDETLPWIFVLNENTNLSEIKVLLQNMQVSKSDIRHYASKNYNWNIRNRNLTDLMIWLSS